MRKTTGCVLIAFLLASCVAENQQADNVLAKINDYEITEDHFKSAFLRYYYKSGQSLQPSFSIKKDILDSEFNVYVLATFAKKNGIASTSEAFQMKGMIDRKVLNEEYLERKVYSGIEVSDSEITNMFLRLNTQLRASHIYAPDKEIADSLYGRIVAGEGFEELAEEVFRNKKLSENGGDLGLFNVDDMDVAFENAAYKLKVGEYSKPVRTAQGYSIIKLTDKLSKPVMSEYELASRKQQIAYLVEKQKRELKSREHMFDFIEELNINNEQLTLLWKEVLNKYASFQAKDLEVSQISNSKTAIIANNDNVGFSLSTEEFINELSFTPASNLNRVQNEESFRNLITGIAYRSFLMDQALEAGIDQISEVKESISQSYDVYLAKNAERQIRESIQVADEEVRKAYYQNPSKYKSSLRLNLSRVVVATENEADIVAKKLSSGASFKDVVEQHTIKNEERLYNGELGFMDISQLGFLSNRLATLEEGELSEPLFYQDGEYHIYKCEGRIESKPLSFKEAYEQVKNEIKEMKFRSRRSEIIEQVKKQNGAMINTQKLKELTIQI